MTADPNDAADLPTVLAERAVVLDGGLATQLEAAGHDLSGALWSARLLAEQPEAVVAAHRAYLDAGAEVIETASYQATAEGFASVGIDGAGTVRLLGRSVELARRAVAEWRDDQTAGPPPAAPRWVAASVGPYGAMLADGSEYTGDYGIGPDAVSVTQLRAFHRPRLEALAAAGPDVIAVETVPCLREIEAVVTELDAVGLPAWIAVTVSGGRLRSGEDLAAAFALASSASTVVAVGVNCSAPEDVGSALAAAAAGTRGLPLVAYPNSGEGWEASTGRWRGAATFANERVSAWLDAGARLVGGCCRVGPAEVNGLATLVRRA